MALAPPSYTLPDPVGGFGVLLAHCGLATTPRQLRPPRSPATFGSRTGRAPGVEGFHGIEPGPSIGGADCEIQLIDGEGNLFVALLHVRCSPNGAEVPSLKARVLNLRLSAIGPL